MDPAAEQRLDQLLDRKAEPPNQFVAYLVEQANTVRVEIETLQRNLADGEQRLGAWRRELLQRQGEVQALVNAVRAWDKTVDKDT